ncbi:MAG: aminoacyl-tRNA hydrolase [Opitutales bacterium]
MPVSLVAALGNPGRDYTETRHNVAWQLIDAWSDPLRPPWKKAREHNADVAKIAYAGRAVWLAKPLTYMNDSGRAVSSLARYFKIPFHEVAVLYDELQLPLGGLKIALKGSAGGHNGVTSVLEHCGSDFVRVRLGIGNRPDRRIDLKDWVLGRFTAEEQLVLAEAMPKWRAALDTLLRFGPETAMNRHNQKTPKPKPEPETASVKLADTETSDPKPTVSDQDPAP